jgi:protein-L-isoaspartate O-methyltransferase
MPEDFRYIGEELNLFRQAKNWKAYLSVLLQPFIQGEVLEVGAGIGSMTLCLCDKHHSRWTCLEPDPRLAQELVQSVQEGPFSNQIKIMIGTVANLPKLRLFDSIIYIDVLEHIENDVMELETVTKHLRPNGVLVVVVPAFQWLFTEFDAAIGHFKRYDKRSLRRVMPSQLTEVRVSYLDSMGMLASVANRLFLRRSMPSKLSITIWDRVLVRLSRLMDPMLGFSIGRSCVGIWRNSNDTTVSLR